MLYDLMKPLSDNPTCPTCAQEMEFMSKKRFEGGLYQALTYECPICHTTERISTRNNRRMDYSFLGITYAVLLSFALGLVASGWMYLNALKKTP